MRSFRLRGAALPSITIFCLLTACRPLPTTQGLLERSGSHANLSSQQLRVMVNEYAKHFAERVELSADAILAEASDAEIRRNALLWKINAISACFQAASRQDPLGAYLDLWILNRQMTQFFETPEGEEQFGAWQSIARNECQDFERRLQAIFEQVGADLPYRAALVESFASEYPLTSLYFDREPMASQYVQDIREPNREMLHVVGDMEQNLIELQKLSVLYAEYLPKQARWEAELLLTNAPQLAVVRQPLQDFRHAVESIARIAELTDAVPDLVVAERRAVLQQITQERRETLRDLEEMRRQTLSALQAERLAVLESLRDERLAVSRELETHLATALQATDDVTRQRVEDVAAKVPAAIDHFFWRTSQLALAALGVALIAAITVLGFVEFRRRRRRSTTPILANFESATTPTRKAA